MRLIIYHLQCVSSFKPLQSHHHHTGSSRQRNVYWGPEEFLNRKPCSANSPLLSLLNAMLLLNVQLSWPFSADESRWWLLSSCCGESAITTDCCKYHILSGEIALGALRQVLMKMINFNERELFFSQTVCVVLWCEVVTSTKCAQLWHRFFHCLAL